nr:MAG TPA: hypothetical protein [Caudoviricetes sp.]
MRHAPSSGCALWLAPFEGFWSHRPRTPRGRAALASPPNETLPDTF